MRKSRPTDEQMIGEPRARAGGANVQMVCRRHGFSEQTFSRRKQKISDLHIPEPPRLNQLEEENRRLKRLVAEAHPCENPGPFHVPPPKQLFGLSRTLIRTLLRRTCALRHQENIRLTPLTHVHPCGRYKDARHGFPRA